MHVATSPGCSPNPPRGGTSTPVIPVDPNEITGYIAESGSHAVSAAREQLYYTIEFENDSNFATTHANTVVVRDTLDGSVFDLNSFAATAFSIGKDVDNINGLQRFTRTMDMRPAINTIAQVQLDYTIDSNFAVATWTFSSLDPMTLQPVVADSLGFLRIGGTGEVDFLIRRKPNLADSVFVRNQAHIVFDNEEPIATSIWENFMDIMPPVSVIDSITYSDSVANIHIGATDNISGVWRYNVYGLEDSVWYKLTDNVPIDSIVALDTSIISKYDSLRTIAIDSAGNMELLIIPYDTTTYLIVVQCDTNQGSATGGGRFRISDTTTLTATPKYGFHFSHWSDGDTTNPRVVIVLSDSSFTALFDTNYYNIALTADDTLKGSVSGGGSHLYMHNARLTATPNYGFYFSRWNDGDTNNPRVVTVLSDSSFTALFDTNYYNIALSADDSLKGSVSGGGSHLYMHNARLIATANYGFHFLRWSDGYTTNPRVVTVLSDSSFTALFDTNYYKIALSADDTLKGSVSGGGSHLYLHNATLTATPNHGFHFSRWSDGDTNNPRLVTVLDDTALTALFDTNYYNIAVTADDTLKGSVSGGGSHLYLHNATLTATPNHGFHFSRWRHQQSSCCYRVERQQFQGIFRHELLQHCSHSR